MKNKVRLKNKHPLLYVITLVFSVMYIIIGYKLSGFDFLSNPNSDSTEYVDAKITKIDSAKVTLLAEVNGKKLQQVDVIFTCEVYSKAHNGEIVTARQIISDMSNIPVRKVEEGDRVILANSKTYNESVEGTVGDKTTISEEWFFAQYSRSNALIVLGGVFVLSVLIFGRTKGVNTIISLALTCLCIIYVLIPSVLGGKNIYFMTALTCAYITVMTLCLVNGYSKKTFSAILGCLGGVLLSALICIVMQKFLKLTGYVSEEDVFLVQLNPSDPIDLKAIVYSSILIGAIGAIMDVSVDISASLAEIARKVGKIGFKEMFTSGMRIGRDILGTMSNTLVLAYLGSSMCSVILAIAYNTSSIYLFNTENIVIEILQALVGSLGILFAIPLTAAMSSFIYNREKEKDVWFMK